MGEVIPETWANLGGLCLVGVDWLTVIISDTSNLSIAAAYLLGVPVMGMGLWQLLARAEPLLFCLVVAFVASCGLGHLFDFLIAHNTNSNLVIILVLQRVMTSVVSWCCILAGFFVVQRRAGLLGKVA